MTGDPRVLAPLQQAFKETDDGRVQQQIVYAWCHETGNYNIYSLIESEIRAWTPPPAEPSLEQRVAELELKLSAVSATMQEHETDLENFGNQIHELFNRTDPEPTAPDDYTPGQYKLARGCAPPINPAPDDPVCLDCGHPKSDHTPNGIVCQRNQSNPEGPHCHCHGYIDPGCKPAPDLDPVRVEAAAKAAWEHGGRMTSWDEASADIHELWIRDAGLMIRAYLKDGGA